MVGTPAYGRRSKFRLLPMLLIAIGVMSCSPTTEPQGLWGKLMRLEVGPDYRRPEITVSKEFWSQVRPAEADSLADLPWWKVFKDKALQNLIAEALRRNYDLQAATARVEQTEALVWVTASPLYPHINYQAFAAREKVFFPGAIDTERGNVTFNNFGGLFNAVWELDVWGRVRRATEAARSDLYAQEDVRRGVMLTLVSSVAADYFSLIELDKELAIAQESERVYKQTFDLFSRRFQFGTGSRLPVVRAQAAYESSLAKIASLRRAIAQQEDGLSILLGAYPGEIKRGEPLTDQSVPEAPVGLTTDLLERRPDIMQAQQNMITANAQIGVAVANFFPRIGLSALYGGQASRIGDVFDNSFSIWNIAASMTGPIFEGGQLLESYYAQRAFWDASVAQYKGTILNAFREVSDALAAQQTLAVQRLAVGKQVLALREAVDLALLRYNGGRATYFEVLEAEQLLFPAEDALAQVERDQLIAVVSLYKALGGGWRLSNAQWLGEN